MGEERTHITVEVPTSLVERADSVAKVLGISRARLLIDALEAELDELAADAQFRRRLSDAYYDGRVEYETVEAFLGRAEALRLKRLAAAIDRMPPEPQLVDDLPDDESFYDGTIPEWTDAESSAADDRG